MLPFLYISRLTVDFKLVSTAVQALLTYITVIHWVRSINLDFVDFVDFSVKRAFDYCGFRHGFLGFRKPRNPCNPHRRKISWFSWFSNLWFVYARDHSSHAW